MAEELRKTRKGLSHSMELNFDHDLVCPVTRRPILILSQDGWIIKRGRYILYKEQDLFIKCDLCRKIHKFPKENWNEIS